MWKNAATLACLYEQTCPGNEMKTDDCASVSVEAYDERYKNWYVRACFHR